MPLSITRTRAKAKQNKNNKKNLVAMNISYLLLLLVIVTAISSTFTSCAKRKRFIDKDAVLNVMVTLGQIRSEETLVFDFGCTSCPHSLYFKALHTLPINHNLHHHHHHHHDSNRQKNSFRTDDDASSFATAFTAREKGAFRVISVVSKSEESIQKVQWTRDSIAYRGLDSESVALYHIDHYGDEAAIREILRSEHHHGRRPLDHTRPHETETIAASLMGNEEQKHFMLERHRRHHVPATVFLRLRSKAEANLLAPILFKNLKAGSRIVSLNFAFDRYQAKSTFVISNEDEDSHEKDGEIENDEDMPEPRAIFVYVVSHEQSSAIEHDIGRAARFSVSLSYELALQRDSSGAGFPVGEMWYHRFLTSRNILQKSSSSSLSSPVFFHGVLSSHIADDDPNGKFDHCLVTIGTKEGYLNFVKFQHPLLVSSSKKGHELAGGGDLPDFEFRLFREDTNEDLTGWMANRIGGQFYETFTIPREMMELRAPFELWIEVRFPPSSNSRRNDDL